MTYRMQVENGYIIYIGQGNTIIDDKYYQEILNALSNMPETDQYHGCRLTTQLTWEIFELETE